MANDRIVAPMTAREIESAAEDTRLALGLDLHSRVAMTPILEQVLYDVIEGYEFHVEEDRVMGNLEGLTDTKRPIIKMKNSVYLGLQKGLARPRMTAAHEFAHLVLHCGLPTYRAFSTRYDALRDPERQANVFAAAFLMPRDAFLKCRTAREAMRHFGVSEDAAMCRARKLRHRFQQGRPVLTVKKKGSDKSQTP